MDKLWNIYIIEHYSVVIIKLERHQNYLEGLLTHRLLGLIPKASESGVEPSDLHFKQIPK